MVYELDELDLKILQELQTDGRISITELAERVGSSRPTITSRLRRLLEEELVVIVGGLNLKKMGFKIACVGLEVKNEGTRRDFERLLRSCPRVLFTFRTPGKANLYIALWSKEDQTINSVIESFRDIENVDIVFTHYLGTPTSGKIMLPVHTVKMDKPPCDRDCSTCDRYENALCLGCPMTKDYRSPF